MEGIFSGHVLYNGGSILWKCFVGWRTHFLEMFYTIEDPFSGNVLYDGGPVFRQFPWKNMVLLGDSFQGKVFGVSRVSSWGPMTPLGSRTLLVVPVSPNLPKPQFLANSRMRARTPGQGQGQGQMVLLFLHLRY